MATKKRLRKQFKRYADKSEPTTKLYSGALGIYIGGTQYVDVPNRPGFVYVRLMNDISQLIQVHNQIVSPVYDLPVLVVRANNRYEIYGRDVAQYGSNWDSPSSYLPRHARQHEFDPDNNGGGDLVFVRGEQFYPLMGFPSGTNGANNILIAPYRYFSLGYWHYTGNTGTEDLLQYRPTGSNNSKLILIGITSSTGNPFVRTGNEFDASITGAAELTQYVPTNVDITSEIPGTIVRLVTGTAVITWANIYDARQYMGILSTSTGTFAGSFLVLNDTPNSYSGQGSKTVAVKSDETGLEFVTSANTFLGLTDTPSSYSSQANKFVAVKGAEDGLEFVDAPGGAGGGSALSIYDNSTFVATGTSISFDDGLTAIATGTTVFVSSDCVLLENITVIDTGTTSIIFSNIPSDYRNLSFKGSIRSMRGATVDTLNFQLNGHTDLVYSYNRAVGTTGWTFTAATGTVVPISATVPSALTQPLGNRFYMSLDMDIPGYATPDAMKSAQGQWGSRSGAATSAFNIGIFELEVDDVDPVTQAKFFLLFGPFTSGSSISMYGLK